MANFNLEKFMNGEINKMAANGIKSSKYLDQQKNLKALRSQNSGEKYLKNRALGGNPEKIYSVSTKKTYKAAAKNFVLFTTELGYMLRSAQDIPLLRQDYISWMEENNYAPTTIKKNAAAICKISRTRMTDLSFKNKRTRDLITQNRNNDVERLHHFSEENHKDLVLICRCTGCRAHDLIPDSLHEGVRGTALVLYNNEPAISFKKGKGGRNRIAIIAGNEDEVKRVCEIFKAAGSEPVYNFIEPDGFKALNAPIHRYRSDYAWRIYDSVARPVDSLDEKDKYRCRGSRLGEIFDRRALKIVNYNLGHAGNRYSEAVNNYLYRRA